MQYEKRYIAEVNSLRTGKKARKGSVNGNG